MFIISREVHIILSPEAFSHFPWHQIPKQRTSGFQYLSKGTWDVGVLRPFPVPAYLEGSTPGTPAVVSVFPWNAHVQPARSSVRPL